MRRLLTVLITAILLSACGPTSTPAPGKTEAAAQATRALPAEASPTPSPSPQPTLVATPTLSSDGLAIHEAALLPAFQADVQQLESVTQYSIDLSVDFEGSSNQAEMAGVARILFTNPAEQRVETIPLMLWPNNEQYRGSLSVQSALIDGQMVQAETELDGLAVRFRLPQALDPGEAADLTVPFQLTAQGPIGQESPHRFGISEGVLFAPTFYPLVPRLIDGQWEVKDAPPGGDTTNSVVAAYHVTIEVPADLTLVASGSEVDRQTVGADRIRVEYVSGPVRDFAFALGDLQETSALVDGTEMRVWLLASHQSDQRRVLGAAAAQLALLNELVGPYPYEELDLVDVPGAYGGIEYPGLVTVGTLGTSWVIEPVVHEVAHQWFYGVLGDDQLEEPWLDEAFATYATALYYENEIDSGRATGYLSDFRDILRSHPQAGTPIGLGVGMYEGRDYSLFVYLKGALFYQELRQRLGDDAFFDFLQNLYQANRYEVIDSETFQAAAEESCSCQLDEMFDLWVFEGGDLALP